MHHKRRRYHTEPRALLREGGLLGEVIALAGLAAAFTGAAILLIGLAP